MQILKRFLPQLIIVLVLCIISGYGIVNKDTLAASAGIEQQRIVILDAGHPALPNTIDQPRKSP